MAEGSMNNKDFLDFVFSFHESMNKNNILLVYEGEITHQVTKAFTSLTEMDMKKEQESNSTQKKVFHVMVECLQNIGKHADYMPIPGTSQEKKMGAFLLSRKEEAYYITTGNVVVSENAQKMEGILNKINSLDHDELKALYKHQIREGRLSNKGGAGLGFIDIAKKTGNKLAFSFAPINDEFSFFIFSCKITR